MGLCTDNIIVSHPVNLALLQQFFNDSSLDGVLNHLDILSILMSEKVGHNTL